MTHPLRSLLYRPVSGLSGGSVATESPGTPESLPHAPSAHVEVAEGQGNRGKWGSRIPGCRTRSSAVEKLTKTPRKQAPGSSNDTVKVGCENQVPVSSCHLFRGFSLGQIPLSDETSEFCNGVDQCVNGPVDILRLIESSEAHPQR